MEKIKDWLGDSAHSVALPAVIGLVVVQAVLGTIGDLLAGGFIVGIVYGLRVFNKAD